MADVRTGLAAALVALGAAGGLAYTARTFQLSQVGQLTGRFESASKQMGDNDETVQLAGIHAMAQLADGWVEQRQTCIDVLCAFLRVTRPQCDLREAHRTTLRIIKAHLRPGRQQVSWQQCEFDLTGAVLKEADFTGINFAGARFLFEEVHFEGKVRFDWAKFAGSCVSFRGAKFSEPESSVSFANASFLDGNVVFDDVTFGGGEASFDNAVFAPHCQVTFEGAQLGNGGSVSFRNAIVQGPGLRFDNARFSSLQGMVRFDGATFSGPVHFDRAEFDGDVTFNGAKLGSGGANLIFAGAKWIKGRISFKGAECEAMTVDLTEPDVRLGKIDFRGADGTPRIIHTNPGPSPVVEGIS